MEEIFSPESLTRQGILILNAFVAAILAGVIGLERESLHKPAGIRTNMIIATVAVLLVSFGRGLAIEFSDIESIQVDPLRVIEAIIVGVSFIGAGTIIKNDTQNHVHNITTAATLLFSAAIGIAVSLQQYILAVGVTLMALFINLFIKKLFIKFNGYHREP